MNALYFLFPTKNNMFLIQQFALPVTAQIALGPMHGDNSVFYGNCSWMLNMISRMTAMCSNAYNGPTGSSHGKSVKAPIRL